MKKPKTEIAIKVGDTYLNPTLNESRICKDFINLLPLNLKLIDLSGIKKYTRLPIELPEEGPQMQTCEIGDLAYWSPGPGLVIFYRQETMMPDSGLYLLGKIKVNEEISKMTKLKIEIIR